VKKYPLFLLLLCISAVVKAQTDTVAAKISKIPIIHVDVLARFPGGDFTKYIAANINYQKKSDRNLRGQVIISLKIDTNGRVSNVNILKSMSPVIDQEVAHVIKSSPKWQPAMVKGKPIGVYMVFNIDMGLISALAPPTKPTPVVATPSKPIIEPVVSNNKKPDVPPVTHTSLAVENKPVLKAIKKQAPPFDKKPVPVEKKPVPQVVKKAAPAPPVFKKAKPVIIKKPAPQVAKKPIPQPVVKKPAPIAVKKPVSQVVKNTIPAPVVKKAEPVVVKKPVPQIVKQIIKPAGKKPVIAPVIKHKRLIANKEKKNAAGDLNQTLGPSSEAQFPNGGLPGFFKYLSENIHYPLLSKINKIEGEVKLTFVVDNDGTVTDVKIISAPAEDLAQEAKRVILAAPKWKPAMQNGTFIKEAFTVPINFKFQDKQNQQ
jgi:TonB family protein